MKKKFFKTTVAFAALVAMLMQNTYGVYAAMEGISLPEVPEIVVEHEADGVVAEVDEPSTPSIEVVSEDKSSEESSSESDDSSVATPIEYADGEPDSTDETPTSDVNYDDSIMLISEEETSEGDAVADESSNTVEESTEADGETSKVDTALDSNISILNDQIAGSGLDSVSIYIETKDLASDDTFRIIFTGAENAKYDTALNNTLFSSAQGTYTFDDLNKEGFNIRAVSDEDVKFVYSSDNGTPVISVASNKNTEEKELTTKVVTLQEGSPVTAVYGKGFESVKIDLDTEDLQDNTKYTLVVNTDAEAKVDGELIGGKITGLTKASTGVSIEGLDSKEFTAYVVSDEDTFLAFEVSNIDAANATATIKVIGESEGKRTVYTYDDEYVSVIATLSDPTAVPDNAQFRVTKIDSQSMLNAFKKAINDSADGEVARDDNFLLYDVAFIVQKTDEAGNIIDGEEEFEPEAGSVSIDIKFKKSQLTDEAGATDDDSVTVYHLPLKDSVKDNIDTTMDATNVKASDIIVEEVDAEISVKENGEDEVVMSLNSLSPVGVVVNGVRYTPGTLNTYDKILGSAKNYGIVASDMTLGGHMETNFAVTDVHGNADIQGPKNASAGGYTYIGSYDGSNLKITPDYGTQSMGIITTIDALKNFGFNMTGLPQTYDGQWRTLPNDTKYLRFPDRVDVDYTSKSYDEIKAMVDGILTEASTKSTSMLNEATATDFTAIKSNSNNIDSEGKVTIDIAASNSSAGTYYVNFDEGEFNGTKLKIKIKSGQNVVLNIPDKNVQLGGYDLYIDGKQVTYDVNEGADGICQLVCYNCPNAESAQTTGLITAPAGTFILPKAEKFEVGNVAAGWLITKKITRIGSEWHCVYKDLPNPRSNPTSLKLKVKKTVRNLRDASALEPFNFVLYKAASNYYSYDVNKLETITVQNDSYTGSDGNYVGYATFSEIPLGETEYNLNDNHEIYYVIKEVMTEEQQKTWSSFDGIWAHIKVTLDKREYTAENGQQITDYFVKSVKYSHDISDDRVISSFNDATSSDGKAYVIPFANTKHSTKDQLELDATKYFYDSVTNLDWPVNDAKFTFKLEALTQKTCGKENTVNEPAPLPTKTEITVDKDNRVAKFDKIVYNHVETADKHGSYTRTQEWYNKQGKGWGYEGPIDNATVYPRCYMYKISEVIPASATETKVIDGVTYKHDPLTGISYSTKNQYVKVWVNSCIGKGGSPKWIEISVNGSDTLDHCGGSIDNIEFINKYTEPKGSIKVTKEVLALGNEYITDETFYFVVKKGEQQIGGVRPITAKETVTIDNLPLGTYSVIETDEDGNPVRDHSDSFKYEHTVTPASVEVVYNQTANTIPLTTITNKRDVESTSITIEGEKSITPSDYDVEENDFAFKISRKPGDDASKNAPLPHQTVVRNDANKRFSFGPIEYTAEDVDKTYKYVITEEKGDIAGMSYSTEEYEVEVKVTMSSDAKVQASKTITKKNISGTQDKIVFNNTFAATGSATFEAKKVYNRPLYGGEFTFELYKSENADCSGATKISSGVITNKSDAEDGMIDFGVTENYSYSDIGHTYYYLAKEVPGDTSSTGITYSGAEYVYVVEIEGVDDTKPAINGKAQLKINKSVTLKNGAGVSGTPEFVNTYNAQGTGSFSVQKVFSGATGDKLRDMTFDFRATLASAVDEAGQAITKSYTNEVTLKGGETKNFSNITFEKPGTYTFNVQEINIPEGATAANNYTFEGIKYDNAVHTVVLVLEDLTHTGSLTITSKTIDGVADTTLTAPVVITNEYSTGDIDVTLEGLKTLSNKTLEAGMFNFAIARKTANAPMPTATTATNGADDTTNKIKFGPIRFTTPGVYEYNITETSVDGNGIKVDTKTVTAKVTITDNYDGTLASSVEYFNGTSSLGTSFTFENRYSADGSAIIEATKILESDVKNIEDLDFAFNFELCDSSQKRLSGDGYYVQNTSTGHVEFAPIAYTLDDAGHTYTYYIHEVVTSKIKGFTYDETYHKVTVKVEDDGDGTLTPTVTYGDDNASSLTITNKYKAEGKAEIVGNKVMSGRKIASDEVIMVSLTPITTGDTNKEQKVQVVRSTTDHYKGSFTFTGLKYTKPGTYQYEVREVSDSVAGTTLDKSVYIATVVVTDGATSATSSKYETLDTAVSYTLNGKSAPILFQNSQTASNEFQPTAKKILNKGTLQANQFSFTLTDETGATETKKNAANGSITFDKRTYNAAGVHTYIIEEVNEGKPGIKKYDDTKYKIVVTLTESETSTLNKTVEYYKKTTDDSDYVGPLTSFDLTNVVFTNEYKAEGKVKIEAEKELKDSKGKSLSLEAGEFKFELVDSTDGHVIETIGNTAAGKVAFTELTYTQDSMKGNEEIDYYYIIREKNVGKAGYTYDDTKYVAKVHLKDEGNGTITPTLKIDKASGELKEISKFSEWISGLFGGNSVTAKFSNTYDANGQLVLSGTKLYDGGRPLTAGMFTFNIVRSDEKYSASVQNSGTDGKTIAFAPIEYTLDDVGNTYTYVISEKNGGQTLDGIEYCSVEYTVVVSVKDDTRDGMLEITAKDEKGNAIELVGSSKDVTNTVNGQSISEKVYIYSKDGFDFRNEYKTTPTSIVIGGSKNIMPSDKDIADYAGQFTFTMTGPKTGDMTSTYSSVKTNGADGAYTFDSISFKRDDLKKPDGTYAQFKDFVYTVTEARNDTTASDVVFDPLAATGKTITVRLTDNFDGTLTASVVNGNKDNAVAFTNIVIANNELVMSVAKKVDGTSATDKEFTFTLTGTDGTNESLTLVNGGSDSFETKVFDLSQVKNADGTYKTYSVDYTITESGEHDGYTNDPIATHTVHVDVTYNETTKTLDIAKTVDGVSQSNDVAVVFTYTNTYTATGSFDIAGTKKLTGRDLESGEFWFEISGAKPFETPQRVSNTLNADGTGSFSFSAIDCYDNSDITKSYVYTVKEIKKADGAETDDIPNVTYDEDIYEVTVDISDNGDGTLHVDKSIKNVTDNQTVNSITFENTFENSKKVKFEAEKSLEGNTLENIFEFRLHEMTGGKLSKDEVVPNDGTGVTFSEIEFDQTDVGKDFIYEISEVAGKYSVYDYSKVKYYAKVVVSIQNNEVVATPTYYSDKDCTTKLPEGTLPKFENKYESNVSVDLAGSKVLKGFDKIKDKGSYKFLLKDLQTGNVIDEYTVNGEGTFKFPSKTGKTYEGTDKKILYYDQDDMKGSNNTYRTERIYEYEVYEENGGREINNVTYDKTVYKITVTLSYDPDTKALKAVTSVNPSIDPKKLVFTNIYKAEGEEPLEGLKTIEGKNLADQAYTFTLYAVKDGAEVELTSVKNNGPKFTIMPGTNAKSGITYLKYTQEDIGSTFEYVVKETATSDGSIKDENVYTVTDVIEKDATGALKINRTIKGADNSTKLVFNNTYEAKGEITLDGTKTMKNKALLGNEFSFVLKDSNNEIVKDKNGNEFRVYNKAASLDKNNEAKVAFEFPVLEFTQDDLRIVDSQGNTTYTNEKTFYYVVEEEGKQAGVTNGGEIYTVAITIKDSGKNDGKLLVTKVVTSDTSTDKDGQSFLDKLVARIAKIAGTVKSEIINFINTYAAKGEWGVDGTKTMEGRELEFGSFRFRLSELTSATGKVVTDKIGDKEVPRTVEVDNTKTDSFTGGIKFTKSDAKWLEYSIDDLGTHYYKVEEIEPENKTTADKYDKSVYVYTVEVTDNGDGTLKSQVTAITKDGAAVTLTDNKFSFVNTYEAKGKIGFDGTKKMEGRELGDDKYSFTITDVATGEQAKVQNDSEGKISFTDAISFLNYTKAGTYQYIIEEDDFASECVTKDTNKYRITVVVKEHEENGKPVYNGVLDARISNVEVLNQNGDWTQKTDYDSVSYFTFTNTYSAEAELKLTGKKHLKRYAQELESKEINATESIDGQFVFLLKKYETEDRTVTGKVLWEKNTACKADGSFAFDIEKFTTDSLKNPASKTGYDTKKTFYYTLEEKNDGKAGITYDTRVYKFNVTVEMVANSKKLNVTVTDANGNAISAIADANNIYSLAGYDFTNIKPEFTSVQGTKTWVDKVKDASSRPDVTINLYAEASGAKKLVDTTVIKAPNSSYSFTNLPVVDENGNTITYSVTESPVDGYASEQNGFNFTNTAGEIQIRKVAESTGLALSGAKLAIIDANGSTVETWTSGSSAHVVEAALTAGAQYTLRELEAPTGYAKAADKKFTVPTDGSTITVVMEDPEIIGSVKLHKLDAETRSALTGAEFALYKENGERVYATGTAGDYTYSESAANGRFAVNGAGELTVKDLPYGNYYFTEIEAPKGYVLSTERKNFSITNDGETVEVTMLNTKETGSVRLRKTNADGSRTLAGAVFELYAKTPSTISSAIASTMFKGAYYRVGSYTTDASGVIYVDNLPWDDYYFVEVQAPSGYEINKDTNGDPIAYTFTIGSSGSASVTYDLGTITNSTTPVPETPETPPVTPSVLGERIIPKDDGRRSGGVLAGVLGVRAAPKQGVLGERIGPVTGDAANIVLWLLLLAACVAAIIGTALAGKKKKRSIAKK